MYRKISVTQFIKALRKCGDLKMEIRDAKLEDAQFIYDIRFKDKVVINNSCDQNIHTFKNHLKFFKKHISEYCIIGNNIGFIRDNNGEISIAFVSGFRGFGFGSEVLRHFKGKAEIKITNLSSYYAFLKAGFKPIAWILEK